MSQNKTQWRVEDLGNEISTKSKTRQSGAHSIADSNTETIPIREIINLVNDDKSKDKSESEMQSEVIPIKQPTHFKCRACLKNKSIAVSIDGTNLCKNCSRHFEKISKTPYSKGIYKRRFKQQKKMQADLRRKLQSIKWNKNKAKKAAINSEQEKSDEPAIDVESANFLKAIGPNSADEELDDTDAHDDDSEYDESDLKDDDNNGSTSNSDELDGTKSIITKMMIHSEKYKKEKFPEVNWSDGNDSDSINYPLTHAYISTDKRWVACCLLGANDEDPTKSNIFVPALLRWTTVATVALTPYQDDLHDTEVKMQNDSFVFPSPKELHQKLTDQGINPDLIKFQSENSKNVKRLKSSNIVQCLYQFVLYPDEHEIMRLAVIINADNETFSIWFQQNNELRNVYYADPNYVPFSYANRNEVNKHKSKKLKPVAFVRAQPQVAVEPTTEPNADDIIRRFGKSDRKLIHAELNKTIEFEAALPRLRQLLANIPNLEANDKAKFGKFFDGYKDLLHRSIIDVISKDKVTAPKIQPQQIQVSAPPVPQTANYSKLLLEENKIDRVKYRFRAPKNVQHFFLNTIYRRKFFENGMTAGVRKERLNEKYFECVRYGDKSLNDKWNYHKNNKWLKHKTSNTPLYSNLDEDQLDTERQKYLLSLNKTSEFDKFLIITLQLKPLRYHFDDFFDKQYLRKRESPYDAHIRLDNCFDETKSLINIINAAFKESDSTIIADIVPHFTEKEKLKIAHRFYDRDNDRDEEPFNNKSYLNSKVKKSMSKWFIHQISTNSTGYTWEALKNKTKTTAEYLVNQLTANPLDDKQSWKIYSISHVFESKRSEPRNVRGSKRKLDESEAAKSYRAVDNPPKRRRQRRCKYDALCRDYLQTGVCSFNHSRIDIQKMNESRKKHANRQNSTGKSSNETASIPCKHGQKCSFWQRNSCTHYHNDSAMWCSNCSRRGHPAVKCTQSKQRNVYNPYSKPNADDPLHELSKFSDKKLKKVLTLAQAQNSDDDGAEDSDFSEDDQYTMKRNMSLMKAKAAKYKHKCNRLLAIVKKAKDSENPGSKPKK